MSAMLYPRMLCVALPMCPLVLCAACLRVNCLAKQLAMCVGVVAILLLNAMDVFSVCGGALPQVVISVRVPESGVCVHISGED